MNVMRMSMVRIKVIISIFVCLISFNYAFSQFLEDNKFYFSGEVNLGNYFGIDFNLNLVQNENYTYKIGFSKFMRKPESQPENFSPGLLPTMLTFGLANPFDQIDNYQISFGKIYKLNKSGSVRTNLNVGLGYSILKEPINWVGIDDGFIGPNYEWDYGESYFISLIINSKFEFIIKNWIGLTVSPMLLINSETIYFGIGFGTIVGYLK